MTTSLPLPAALRGFRLLMSAQFVSGLADSALLLVAIGRLAAEGGPVWLPPLLKLAFTLAYVLLAPFVGPLADRAPKAAVMSAANALKAGACAAMALGAPVGPCFALAGAGAALYSPAKYGLVTELMPPHRLVAANGWIEVATVLAILLGTMLGGALLAWLAPATALAGLLALYGLAALLNLGIPDSGARYPAAPPLACQLGDFARANARLWRDPLGRVSLATTTLFWGVGATLQFLVLRWAEEDLGLTLAQAAWLQGLSATGVVVGALLAGRLVPLERAPQVLWLGVPMGLLLLPMPHIDHWLPALPLLACAGLVAGLFVVPMNALLQHRGAALLSAGRSIAVQNFNENASVLLMLAGYAWFSRQDLPLELLIRGFGLSIALLMALIALHHRHHHRHHRQAHRHKEIA